MNEKLIEQQQQQIKNLSDEITLMRMKYEGIGSIYNRQHLQSQLDQAGEKVRRYEKALMEIAEDEENCNCQSELGFMDYYDGYEKTLKAKKALEQSS